MINSCEFVNNFSEEIGGAIDYNLIPPEIDENTLFENNIVTDLFITRLGSHIWE